MSHLFTKRELLHSNTDAGIKYRGLKNLGSTCYLNSVLQVLFMTPKFGDAVERFDETLRSTTIDAELKGLFRQLREWPRSPTPPPSLIKKLEIYNVYEQRDAAEYLERILRLTRPEASEVFHGELTHRRECSQCKEGSDDHGSFWTLNLGINSVPTKVYDVRDGLEAFFSQSTFIKDNQLYCDTCQAKEDSIIECIFKKPPEVLVVLLKRFEFSYDVMGYVKNNSPVNVLLNIEIPKDRSYELYATVDHYGDLSGGHYTATIKSPDDADSWYNFDDSSVTRKDNFNPDWSRSAYLLFYRHRVSDVSPMTQPSKQISDSLQGVHVGSSVDIQSGSSVYPQSGSSVAIQSRSSVYPQSGSSVDMQSGSSVYPQSGSSVDMQSGSSVDIQSRSSVYIQSGSSVDIQSGSSLDIQSGSSLDIQSGSSVDMQSGSSVDIQSGSSLDIQSGSSLDIQSGSSVDMQSGSSVDMQSGSSVEPQSRDSVEGIHSIKYLHIYMEEEEMKGNVVTDRRRTKVGEINPTQLKVLKQKRKQEMNNDHSEQKKSKPTLDS